ncbi:transcription factor of the MADS box [Lunasporangiospora selenospora]|uniref:Transcription factor of the MADS box n=2 Tax=Mortierellaceae TaxID=4854 RepID=A0A9P6FKT2_9FUNG|nr:transcription factor of the MADS box [Lunasporangiospora selenospora]
MSSSKRTQEAVALSSPSATGNGATQGGAPSDDGDDHIDKKFKQEPGDDDEEEDEDEDEPPKTGKRAGRRKIKIEYIEDKSRRHITFSKRKSGIMKKAYELSTLTGTQVLLLVVSETGLVYTFTTPKLQPLVTKAEGKNLIQACLHAPDKEATPERYSAGDQEGSPAASGDGDADEHGSPSPVQQSMASPVQPSPSQVSPAQQPQGIPPPHMQGGGGYGSSSAMNVPGYPPPYSHIPFGGQPPSVPYNYPPPNMGMHYQNPSGNSNGPPHPPPATGPGGAPAHGYWTPGSQAPPIAPPSPKGGRKDK